MSDELNTNIPRLKDQKRKRNEKPHSKYYNTKAWKTIRNKYLREHPLCERCLEKGIVKPAEDIHHICNFMSGINEQQRYSLLTDTSNLMSLCRQCHLEIHNKIRQEKK